MKPRLPIDVKPGDLCDRKGVPIVVGDLIRTDHFRDRRKRMHYVYHVVTIEDGAMQMTPVKKLAYPDALGGQCWLHTVADGEGVLRSSDVLAGSPYPDERKRRKLELVTG